MGRTIEPSNTNNSLSVRDNRTGKLYTVPYAILSFTVSVQELMYAIL